MSNGASSRDDSQHRWYVAVLCFLTFLCASLDRHILGLLVEPMQRDLGISDTMFGLLAGGAFILLYVVASLPAGRLVDSGPRPRLLAGALLLWSLATLATGFTSAFWLIFFLRVLVGLGESMVSPATNSIVADLFEGRQFARALSLISYGGTLGAGLVSILASALYFLAGSEPHLVLPIIGPVPIWRAVFIAAGIPGLILAPLLWFTVPDPTRRRVVRTASGEPVRASAKAFLQFMRGRARLIALMLGGYGCFSVANAALIVWLPTYFVRMHDLPIGTVGLWLGAAYLVIGLVAMLVNSSFIDARLLRGDVAAPLRLARLYALAGVVPAIVMAVAGTWYLAIFAGCLLIVFLSGFLTVSIAVPRLCPQHVRGQVVATHLITFHTLGGIGGPLLVGLLNDGFLGGVQLIGTSLAIVIGTSLSCAAILLSLGINEYRATATDIDHQVLAATGSRRPPPSPGLDHVSSRSTA